MTFSVHGLAVSRGVAIGRAVIVAASRIDVAHYLIAPEEAEAELDRLRRARTVVADDIARVQHCFQLRMQAPSLGTRRRADPDCQLIEQHRPSGLLECFADGVLLVRFGAVRPRGTGRSLSRFRSRILARFLFAFHNNWLKCSSAASSGPECRRRAWQPCFVGSD